MRFFPFAVSLSLIAGGAQAGPRTEPVQEIVAAERAFAADTAARGGSGSFRAVVAPDAIALFPDPATGILNAVNAKQRIESRPVVVRPSTVKWWPSFAGAARSGEMGFTTGPVIFPEGRGQGFIFTVWVKQPDGTWKFFFDGGPATDTPTLLTPESPVETLAFARRGAASADAAKAEVAAAEARIARAAAADSKAAYLPFLTETTRLMGSGIAPTTGIAAAPRELDRRGKAILFEPLGSLAAKSGDLVFTYGRTLADGKTHGGYTRIWQKARKGWRIVIDQIQVPPPPAPPPAAAN